MLIAHMADVHLGKRLYGLEWYEEQLMKHFEEAVDAAIREHVDALVISGDLFDEARPPNRVLKRASDIIRSASSKGIRVYITTGDHDTPKSVDVPPTALLRDAIAPQPGEHFFVDRVQADGREYFFVGLAHARLRHHESGREAFVRHLRRALEGAPRDSVLIMHQNIVEFFNLERGISLADIPTTPKYVAMGHLHMRIVHRRHAKGGVQVIAYPGSLEILDAAELEEFRKNGKGFYLVDLSGDEPSLQKVDVRVTPFEAVSTRMPSGREELERHVRGSLARMRGLLGEGSRGILLVELHLEPGALLAPDAELSRRVERIAREVLGEAASYLHIKTKVKMEKERLADGITSLVPQRSEASDEVELLADHLAGLLPGASDEERRRIARDVLHLVDLVLEERAEEALKVADELRRNRQLYSRLVGVLSSAQASRAASAAGSRPESPRRASGKDGLARWLG
ncbi:MAG: DNA repair exonuclease [Desulfurococcaceae archaeon]